MKYLIWRNVIAEKEVAMELGDELQLFIGGLFIDWDDETELKLRYFDWDEFEVVIKGNLMTVVEVKE